jgi:hypothetical protein
VWDGLERTPAYAAMASLLDRLFGPDVADAIRAPFRLGDEAVLRGIFDRAGVGTDAIERRTGPARFPSIRDWIYTDVRGWIARDEIGEPEFERLVGEGERELARFVGSDGQVAFEMTALLASASAQ